MSADNDAPPPLFALIAPGDWTEQALCAQTDPDLFFPDKGGETRTARALCRTCTVRALCRTCTVRAECLDYALAVRPRHGIWGGLTERQLRALIRALDNTDKAA